MRMSRSAYYQSTDRSGTGTYVSDASLLEMRFILFALSADSAILALDSFLLKSGMIVTEVSPRITDLASTPTGDTARDPVIDWHELRRLFRVRPRPAPGSAAVVQGRWLPAHRHPFRRRRVIGPAARAARFGVLFGL